MFLGMENPPLAVSETLRLAEKYGIPVARTFKAGAELPVFPLVAKPDSAEHKSERGLVFVGIKNAGELETALGKIGRDNAIIQELVFGTELIVGAKKDPVFGRVVMVGIGGTLAEAYGDVSFGISPLKESDAERMISKIRGQKLLDGFRGKPAVNRKALARLLVSVSTLAETENVLELDLNPVMATPDGRLVAVDGRAVLG
jgi:acyl-CoA synthetase (NDP forming)